MNVVCAISLSRPLRLHSSHIWWRSNIGQHSTCPRETGPMSQWTRLFAKIRNWMNTCAALDSKYVHAITSTSGAEGASFMICFQLMVPLFVGLRLSSAFLWQPRGCGFWCIVFSVNTLYCVYTSALSGSTLVCRVIILLEGRHENAGGKSKWGARRGASYSSSSTSKWSNWFCQ